MKTIPFRSPLVSFIIAGFFVLNSFVATVFAAPQYSAGQTLDPACLPTDPTCTVPPPAASGVNSDITQLTSLTAATTTNLVATNATSTNIVVANILQALTGAFTNLVATNATTTNATTTNLYASVARIGSLNGVLSAVNGLVSATSTPTFANIITSSTTATSTFAGFISAKGLALSNILNSVLATDGSGNLVATSTLTTGGPVGSVQYNNGGTLSGTSTFAFATTTNTLTVTNLNVTGTTSLNSFTPVVMKAGLTLDQNNLPVAGTPHLGFVSTGTRLTSCCKTNWTYYISYVPHIATDYITDAELAYANYSGAESAAGGPLTIRVSIEYPVGTLTQVTFSGNATGTIPDGGTLISDMTHLATPIPKGATFWTRTWENGVATYEGGNTTANTYGSGYQNNFVPDTTMIPGTSGLSPGGFYYGPVAIIATTTLPSFVLYGDSRTMGQTQSPDSRYDQGYEAFIGSNFGYADLGVPSDALHLFVTNDTQRLKMIPFATHVIIGYGINDLNDGNSTSTFQTNMAIALQQFGNRPTFGVTIEPQTNSSDGWTSTYGQSLYNSVVNTKRIWINNAYRNNTLATLSGYIEAADLAETSRDSGIWKPYTTSDGLHANNTILASRGTMLSFNLYGSNVPYLTYNGGTVNGSLTMASTTINQLDNTHGLSIYGYLATTTALSAFVDVNSVANITASGTLAFMSGLNKIGFGTTTPSNNFVATGTIQFNSLGAGTVTTDATGKLVITSDERLKDIKGSFSTGLDAILALKPILYNWNQTSGNDTGTTYAGFSAQNVQTVIPEAIGHTPDGYLTLQDRPIEAALVNSIKQLNVNINQLASSTASTTSAFALSLATTSVDVTSQVSSLSSKIDVLSTNTLTRAEFASSTSSLASTTATTLTSSTSFIQTIANAVIALIQSSGTWVSNQISAVTGVFTHLSASDVTTQQLCVGKTCVTEDQLKQVLQNENVAAVVVSRQATSGNNTPSIVTPTSSTTPTTPNISSTTPTASSTLETSTPAISTSTPPSGDTSSTTPVAVPPPVVPVTTPDTSATTTP